MFTPGTILAGKYQLVEIAGQGGMATVWLAQMRDRDGSTRPVAVKVMLQRLCNDPHFVNLFVEEARVSAQLQHPNVVHIHDFGEHEGIYYLAMEWVDGLDLLDYTRSFTERGYFVPWAALATISVEVLKGLHAAHSHSDESGAPSPIFHRDVTPHNILIGLNGAVKLTDFGLAKATDRGTMTLPHVLKGKISYTAPEMTRGVRANERTDLFSLGVTFWECLAARKMFDAASPMQIVRQIQAWNVPSLDEIRPDLPGDVVGVVNKAIARDPAERFASARDMALALAKLLPPRADLPRLGKSVVEAKQRILDARRQAASDEFERKKDVLRGDAPVPTPAASFRKADPNERAARAAPKKPDGPPNLSSVKIPKAPPTDVKISVREPAPLSVVEELSGLEEVSDSALLPASEAAPAGRVAPAPPAPPAPRPAAPRATPPPPPVAPTPAAPPVAPAQAAPVARTPVPPRVAPSAPPAPPAPPARPAPPAPRAAPPAAPVERPAAPAAPAPVAAPVAPAGPAAKPAAPAAARPVPGRVAPAAPAVTPAAPAVASVAEGDAGTSEGAAMPPTKPSAAGPARPRVARPAEPSLLDISIEFDLMGGKPRGPMPTLPSAQSPARKPAAAGPEDDEKKDP